MTQERIQRAGLSYHCGCQGSDCSYRRPCTSGQEEAMCLTFLHCAFLNVSSNYLPCIQTARLSYQLISVGLLVQWQWQNLV